MSSLGNVSGVVQGRWVPVPDVDHLRTAAASWCAGDPEDQLSSRLFLSMFAVYLVKHFRTEDERLDRTKAPDRIWHHKEHRRLVRQLRDLMTDIALELDVTLGIHAFLETWRLHQESASLRRAPTDSRGH